MKRSEINNALKYMEDILKEMKMNLPPFCSLNVQDWKALDNSYNEIRDNKLGWDITDFGSDDFEKVGFSLITLRNGNVEMNEYKKPYAEKIILLKEGQMAPMHFHWYKMEDIINRGGGTLLISVYSADKNGNRLETDVEVMCDGHKRTVKAGTSVEILPGQSITIPQYMYHDFHVKEGTGDVVIGEVSMCNDDDNDNRFYEAVGRFPEVEEDEQPYRVLCNEYDKY